MVVVPASVSLDHGLWILAVQKPPGELAWHSVVLVLRRTSSEKFLRVSRIENPLALEQSGRSATMHPRADPDRGGTFSLNTQHVRYLAPGRCRSGALYAVGSPQDPPDTPAKMG